MRSSMDRSMETLESTRKTLAGFTSLGIEVASWQETEQALADGSLDRPVALLLGEASDPRIMAIVDELAADGSTTATARPWRLVFEDRRVSPEPWERFAPKLEALTGRFGVPWLGFLTPDGTLYFGAVEVTVSAREEQPGLEQLLTFAYELHRDDPTRATHTGVALHATPTIHEDPFDLGDPTDHDGLFRAYASELRARQDLHTPGFTGRTRPGLPTMLFWVRYWERFRDRGLDIRLQRMLDNMPMLIGEPALNPWTHLWTLWMSANVVREATRVEGLDGARAEDAVRTLLEDSAGRATDSPETQLHEHGLSRVGGARAVGEPHPRLPRGGQPPDLGTLGTANWPAPLMDWDHPSHTARWLEEDLADAARSLDPAVLATLLGGLGLAGIGAASALLRS